MGSQCCKCANGDKKHRGSVSSVYRFRGDVPMPSDRYQIQARGNVVQLTLKQSQKEDSGHYALVAKKLSSGLSLPSDGSLESKHRICLSIQDPKSLIEEGEPPIFLRRLSDLAVKVGTRTRFLVEIRSSTSPKVTWHKNDELVQSGPRLSFVHEGNFYCVDVAPVMVDDQGHWTCMAENGSGRSSCTSFLSVIVPKAYKKPEFVEELKALLTETGTVSLECKVVGVPTPVLKWFKDQKEIKAGDVFALTANADDPTSLGTYTCEAVNCMGTACSSSKVHVVGKGSREGSLKPADALTPSGPLPVFEKILRDESCRIGDTLVLSCQVHVPPWPKAITWYNKEGRVEPSEKYHVIADGLGGYSIEIKGVEAMDEGEWKCVATSLENMKQFTTCHVAMSIPKNYRMPRFMESLKAVLTEEGLVSFECKVVGFPTPLLRWFKDGQELHPGDVYQLTGTNSLGSYCCIARNCMGEAKSIAELTVEDIQNQLNDEERMQLMSSNQAPKFVKGLRSCEARINEDFTFTIQVSVSPEPSLSWYRDDVAIIESEKYRLAKEALGTCNLEVKKLEFMDQAEWKCVAANDFGHSVTSCFLKLIIPKHFKKPKFLESLRAILSEEGAVNLECKVIGVPQPILKWYKDGVELKPGDIHRIISGQDGTCCLGTYTCEATNCMGSVSSSASLLGFEDRVSVRKEEAKEPPTPLHELARNLSLSTIHEERTSQLYDTPQTDHSITMDDRGEVSFSFDGKEVSVSLYETPDLTEEEALQIVEMYADQLSEHITEGNIIELPPMRFTKETSTTGNLLMEAVVIDVSPDYFVPDEEGDDLRTEADVEDVSIMDDQMQSLRSSSFAGDVQSDRVPSGSPPSRPPRRKESRESFSSRSERSEKSLPKGFDWSESYHSAKEPSIQAQSLQGQDDSAEAFTDALSSSGAGRSRAEESRDIYASFVEQTIEKLSFDETTADISNKQDLNAEGATATQIGESFVEEIPIKRKKRKGKASRTPSLSSKASSEESYSMEVDERGKRRSSKSGKGRDRRGSASSNKSGKGRSSRSGSESGKFESAVSADLRRRESDATIMVDDVRIEQIEEMAFIESGERIEPDYLRENERLEEQQTLQRTEVTAHEADSSTLKSNKERLLESVYKLSEPVMSLRDNLVNLDTLLPLFQPQESSADAERTQNEITEKIVLPVESLCEQVSEIETKALKSAGDRSLAQSVRISLLEAIGGPTEELLRGIELIRRQSGPYDPKSNLIVLESLTDPVDEILVGLTRIEKELTSREGAESALLQTEKPIALERMSRGVSRLGENVVEIVERKVLFGDESTSLSVIERLQSVHQSLEAFLSTIPLSEATGALENNVDTLVVETLVRPVEELSRNLNSFGASNATSQTYEEKALVDLEKSMIEMRTRLEALTLALETYERESGERGITELHADLVKFLRYTMDDAVERLEKLKVKKRRVTQEIAKKESAELSTVEERSAESTVESSEPEETNVLQELVKNTLAVMETVTVPSIAEAQIAETHSLESSRLPLEIIEEKSSTETEETPATSIEKKKKDSPGEKKVQQVPELDTDLSLPEMLLDPLIDVQANLSDVISDFESQESAEESSLPGSSELAACLLELRESVATAAHTATTLKSASTVDALVDLREPLLDLQLAMTTAVSPGEVKLIREATAPLTELKVIVAAAIDSAQTSEASRVQMKSVLRMLEDIEAEVSKVETPAVVPEASVSLEIPEVKVVPTRPPEAVEKAAIALTGVHFALSTVLERITLARNESEDSATARQVAERTGRSHLISSIEELRQSVGNLAVAVGSPVVFKANDDQYNNEIFFDELSKLEEPLLNLQKVLLTERHDPDDRHVLNDVAAPIRNLKEVVQNATKEIGSGPAPVVLELIEDVEKDVTLIAMEALKKALAAKSESSEDDGRASISSSSKPGEVPAIISMWLDPIEDWLTSTAEESVEIEEDYPEKSTIVPVIDDFKRELLKIAIQTSYSEPPSDAALIESLTELQEPLARVCAVLTECHEPESLEIVEGLVQPTRHLLGTILDASLIHEAARVLRPVMEAIEELENQIPLTIKRINYEKALQRVVRSMTPEEPKTLVADDLPEMLAGVSGQADIAEESKVPETAVATLQQSSTDAVAVENQVEQLLENVSEDSPPLEHKIEAVELVQPPEESVQTNQVVVKVDEATKASEQETEHQEPSKAEEASRQTDGIETRAIGQTEIPTKPAEAKKLENLQNLRSDTVELITVDNRPFSETITQMEAAQSGKVSTSETSRADQLDLWTLTLLGPLDRLGNAVLSLDRSIDELAHGLLCRPLDSLHKQIEIAESQFNRPVGQSLENDVETIIEGFLSPVNQLHSALSAAVRVWNDEQPRIVVRDLLRSIADSSTELCGLLDSLREKLIVQKAEQTLQAQQEDASLVETINAVVAPLEDVRNLIEDALKSLAFADSSEKPEDDHSAHEQTKKENEAVLSLVEGETSKEIVDSRAESLEGKASVEDAPKASVSQAQTSMDIETEDILATEELEKVFERQEKLGELEQASESVETSVTDRAATSQPETITKVKKGIKGKEDSMDIEETTAKPLEELIEAIVDSSVAPRHTSSSPEDYQSISPDVSEEAVPRSADIESAAATAKQKEQAELLGKEIISKEEITAGAAIGETARQAVTEILAVAAGVAEVSESKLQILKEAAIAEDENRGESLGHVAKEDLPPEKATLLPGESLATAESEQLKSLKLEVPGVSEANVPEEGVGEMVTERSAEEKARLSEIESLAEAGLTEAPETRIKTVDAASSQFEIAEESFQELSSEKLEQRKAEISHSEELAQAGIVEGPEMLAKARDAKTSQLTTESLEENLEEILVGKMGEEKAQVRHEESLARAAVTDAPDKKIEPREAESSEVELETTAEHRHAENLEEHRAEIRDSEILATAVKTEAAETRLKETSQFADTLEESVQELVVERSEKRTAESSQTGGLRTARIDAPETMQTAGIGTPEMMEERLEEIISEGPSLQEANISVEELRHKARVAEIEAAKVAKLREEDTIEPEKSTIVEIVETPTQKIFKIKRAAAADEEPQIEEKIVVKPVEDVVAMEEQNIVEVVETPTEKVIKLKIPREGKDGIAEEVFEEIVLKKPVEGWAKSLVEEERLALSVSEAKVQEFVAANVSSEKTKENLDGEEIEIDDGKEQLKERIDEEARGGESKTASKEEAEISLKEETQKLEEETFKREECERLRVEEEEKQREVLAEKMKKEEIEAQEKMREDEEKLKQEQLRKEEAEKLKREEEEEEAKLRQEEAERVEQMERERQEKEKEEAERRKREEERVREEEETARLEKEKLEREEREERERLEREAEDKCRREEAEREEAERLKKEEAERIRREEEEEERREKERAEQIQRDEEERLRRQEIERMEREEEERREREKAEEIQREEEERLKNQEIERIQKEEKERMEREEAERIQKEEEERLREEELERERMEAEKLRKEEAERLEKEELERKKREAERLKREELERVEMEEERIRKEEAERLDKEKLEREKQEAEKLKQAELERERQEEERLKKEEAERLEREETAKLERQKQEEERVRKEEAERLEREKQEAERSKKEELERAKKEEEERLEKEEREKLEREKLEAERQEEKERAKKEEEERIKKEEAAKLEREKQEAERLKQEEKERAKKEEEERIEKEEAAKREEEERIKKEEAAKREEEERIKKEEAAKLEREKQEAERLKQEERERAKREEEERIKKEEAAKLEREKREAEKLEREKQEAERLKQEEVERAKKEEEERLKKEEAAKLERERQEAERLKQEELERAKKEEEERLKKEEAAKLERERQEAERLKQEELERAKKEEEERLKKEEAAKLERERQEAERLKQEELEHARKEEEKRLKKEEAAKLEREKQEAEKLEREELERAKKEEEDRLKKEEAAKLERERQEAERLKQEELERARKEEEERLKKEEAAKLEREKQEAKKLERAKKEEEERLKKEEAAKLEREKQEAEKLKQEELERAKKEEEERLKKEEAAKLEREKQEAERSKQEELERAKKEEEERLKKEESEKIKKEEEKLEREKQEAERLRKERAERVKREEEERLKKDEVEKLEKERLRKEELERAKKDEEAKLEKEKTEKGKQEAERREKEKAAKLEKDKEIERQKQEEDKLQKEKLEKERETERLKLEEEKAKKAEAESQKIRESQQLEEKKEAEKLKNEGLEQQRKGTAEATQDSKIPEEDDRVEKPRKSSRKGSTEDDVKELKKKDSKEGSRRGSKKEDSTEDAPELQKKYSEEGSRRGSKKEDPKDEVKGIKKSDSPAGSRRGSKKVDSKDDVKGLKKKDSTEGSRRGSKKEDSTEDVKVLKKRSSEDGSRRSSKKEDSKDAVEGLKKEEGEGKRLKKKDSIGDGKRLKKKDSTEGSRRGSEKEDTQEDIKESKKEESTEVPRRGSKVEDSKDVTGLKKEDTTEKSRRTSTKDGPKDDIKTKDSKDEAKELIKQDSNEGSRESKKEKSKDEVKGLSREDSKEEPRKVSKKGDSKYEEKRSQKQDSEELVEAPHKQESIDGKRRRSRITSDEALTNKENLPQAASLKQEEDEDEKTPMNSEQEIRVRKHEVRMDQEVPSDHELPSSSTIRTDSEMDSEYSESSKSAVSRDQGLPPKTRRRRSAQQPAIEVDQERSKERLDNRETDRPISSRTRDETFSSDDKRYTPHYSSTSRIHEFTPGPRDRGKRPSFCTKLTDRTAAEGSRIKLTCTVLGDPEPLVYWTKDGKELPTSSNRHCTIEEYGMASLELYAALPKDSGEYSCVARNVHGQAYTEAKLKVYPGYEPLPARPTFTRSIKDTYNPTENELVLECRVRGQPSPKITWLKDGQVLEIVDRYQQCDLGDGICRLKISRPDFYDGGLYTCRAENDSKVGDCTSHVVNFDGKDHAVGWRGSYRNLTSSERDTGRPRFSSHLTDHSVPAGGTIALQVEVKGVPQPDITWMRGDKREPISAYKARTFADAGVYTLIVPEATESETGTYVCRASNAYGYVDTAANVEVVPSSSSEGGKPAMFVSRPAENLIYVTSGEDVSVSFRVNGVPKPRIVWMKGLRDITNGPRSYKESSDDYVRLTLKRAAIEDEGTYCIMAKNRYGCDRTFYTVKVKQRARSLTPSHDWATVDTDNLLTNIHDTERSYLKQVPGPITSEPVVVDGGRNWLALSWGKAVQHGPAPVVAYRVDAWLLGGEGGARWAELGITPVNAFDAFNLRPGGEYKFRITPRNRYGWGEALTMTSSVTVQEIVKFPEFTKILPGQLKALRSELLHLECEVRSESKAEVKWYRDTTDVDSLQDPRYMTHYNGSKCTMTIQSIKENDSGRYVCEATNPAGRVSTFARVQVVTDPKIVEADEKLRKMRTLETSNEERPPEFTMRLRDRRVQMTYPVRLTCQVSGHPEPEVTWYKNREEIFPDDNVTFWDDESHFHTLEISHSNVEDSGIYMAKARNFNGSVSCRCHLVVDKGIRAYVAPEFLRFLDAVYTVKSGGELRLTAQIEAYPTVGIVWHRDGHRLRPSRSTVMTLNHDGSVELSLAHVTPRDAGLYCCTATNEVGQTESTTRVTVVGSTDEEISSISQSLPDVVESLDVPYSKEPLFVTKPLSTEAVEGDTVIILCEVVGDPKPEVIWLRDFLRPDYYRDAAHFRRVGAGPQYRLEIPYAKLDFTGAYTVIAKNCHGEAKAIISLQIYARGQGKSDSSMEHTSVKHGKVQTLPSIKRPLRDLRCCDGDAVTLICRVYATPEPDVRWEKSGKLLPLGDDFVADFDGETARLSIQHVYPEDEGEYTCVAYNDLGKAFTSACLIVDVPEGKESALSRRLIRPIGLLSAESTPISTPRSTPIRSLSPACVPSRRELKPAVRTPRGQSIARRPRLPIGPKFYAVPHNRVAEEGETVRFQCAIAGHPTPWVTWDKDGIPVTPTTRITLKEKDDVRILEITEINHEDAGLYRITLENDVGRTEATARLEIIKGRHGSLPRTIRTRSASPRTYSIYSRSPVTMAVRGDTHLRPSIHDSVSGRGGALSPTLPRWQHRSGKPPTESPEPARRTNKQRRATRSGDPAEGAKQPSPRVPTAPKPRSSSVPRENRTRIPISPVNTKKTSKKPVQGEAPAGHDRSNVNSRKTTTTNGSMIPKRLPISRSRSPNAEQTPDSCSRNGESAKLRHSRAGHLEVTLHDETVDKTAPDSRSHELLQAEVAKSLQVSTASKNESETTRSSRLPVDGSREPRAPVILAAPADLLALRGTKVMLLASFDGEPQPRVRWLRKGRDVRHDDKAEIETSRGLTCLTLNAVTTEQTGKYAVTLENIAGRDCRYVNLTVEGVPDPPAGTPCVQSITRSGKAIVTWRSPSYDGGCAVTGYSVEMKRSEEPCWIAIAEARHSLSHTVTGLEPENSYSFRVRAENAHGLSEPSATSETVTVPGENDEEIGGQVFTAEINQIEIEEEEEEFEPAFEARVVSPEDGSHFEERYDIKEELGKGRYGVVRRIVEKSTGLSLAAKFVRTIKAKDRQQVHDEIGIMNRLRHPKLLRLAAAFENPKEMIMVTEYISGGELFERVVADDFTLTEKDSILFVKQICEGVEYMHDHYVVHLDLKPENIMCHTRTSHRIKLIDFGLAQTLNPDTPVRVLFGTPEFIPPEIIGFEPIGTESDMWSVGVICYVLLTGLSPFMGDNDAETFANITRADFDFDDKAFTAISSEAKDFISALLIKRKELRMSAKQCLEHPWLAQQAECMSSVALPTDKLKKFIVRRKWQKTGNAIRALGRMAILSANSRKNLSAASSPTKTSFDDELFSDVTGNGMGFKPIQPVVIIEDRTVSDAFEKKLESIDQEEETMTNDENGGAEEVENELETANLPEPEIPKDEDFSNGISTEDPLTVTELDDPGNSEDDEHDDESPLIQEFDDFIKNDEFSTQFSNTCIEEITTSVTADDVIEDLVSGDSVTSFTTEILRKQSFSSFVNLEISDEAATTETQRGECENELVQGARESRGTVIEATTKAERTESRDEEIEVLATNSKRRENTGEISTIHSENVEENTETSPRTPVVTKVWCKTNNSLLVDEEDENARLKTHGRSRPFVRTGSVSRTARMFEKVDDTNNSSSAKQQHQNPTNRSQPIVPETRPQNERIRKAFAFWNK
ncbi:titin homolog isoform X2 [Venturia canescens]|uniref:titin homolog isoform X2 n=1 Tax=Venturia canescens TaxID=32260 RepID=UPI001C9C0875|nr:titin homolog isoform X2 [Venturia canescens]